MDNQNNQGIQDIGVTQPAYGQPGIQDIGATQPAYGQTGMQDIGATQPAYGQTGMQNIGATQPAYGQTGMQNMGATQPAYGQTGMQNMGATQPAYGQTGMQNMGATQPAYGQTGMQNMGATQPAYGQTGMRNMGATQPAYGQPMMQQGMPGYGQPYGAPQKVKKPLSKGAKIGIISGLAAALLVGIFFIFIFPILTSSKLGGEYKYKGSYYTEYYLFDDGIWVNYDIDDGETEKTYYAIGTYVVNGDKITLTNMDGDNQTFTYDKKKNTLTVYGTKYTSSNKKAKLEVDIDKDYLDSLKNLVTTAAQTALADEDVYEEAIWWESYYVYGSDLKDPYTEFEKELALNLGYSNDKKLQFLLENSIISFDIQISQNGTVTVDID